MQECTLLTAMARSTCSTTCSTASSMAAQTASCGHGRRLLDAVFENNAYLDGVVQGTWYDMTAQSSRTLFESLTRSFRLRLAASLEGGYPFDLGGGWQIEPQAQLIYQTSNGLLQ